MNPQEDFADRLVDQQEFTPDRQREYQRRLTAMIEKELTTANKIRLGFSVLIGLIVMCTAFYGASLQIPLPLRVGIGLLGIAVFVITVLRTYALCTGKINLRLYPKLTGYTAFYGVILFVLAVIFTTVHQANSTFSVWMVAISLFPLVVTTSLVATDRMYQAELDVKEKLLEMELRLIEIDAKLSADKEA